MTTPTLLGHLAAWLRLGSTVVGVLAGGQGVIVGIDPDRDEVCVAWVGHDQAPSWMPRDRIALDLSDPTGRAHAAWWLNDHDEDTLAQAACEVSGVDDDEAWRWLIVSATSGDPLPDARVEFLRLVCLHVAGLTPSPA